MDGKKIINLVIALLLGFMLTACAGYSGYYGDYGHRDRPWWEHRDVGGERDTSK